jgi:peptidoglycan/xylan/chitin deacetylase (PgdA/CDA1 family)
MGSYVLPALAGARVRFVSDRSRAWALDGPVGTALCERLGIEDRTASGRGYALTFDDGPTRPSTSAILDILGELGVPAAFFVIGANVRRSPELLARMHAQGHIVANHSLDHAHLGMLRGWRSWDRQVRETDRLIEQVIGARPKMFRPPMGIKTCMVMRAAVRQGHSVITWSRRAGDGVATTTRRILDHLRPHTVAGDVLMLHDGVEPNSGRDQSATIAAIKPFVLQLRDRGLEPVRLDELLGLPAYAPAGIAEAAA